MTKVLYQKQYFTKRCALPIPFEWHNLLIFSSRTHPLSAYIALMGISGPKMTIYVVMTSYIPTIIILRILKCYRYAPWWISYRIGYDIRATGGSNVGQKSSNVRYLVKPRPKWPKNWVNPLKNQCPTKNPPHRRKTEDFSNMKVGTMLISNQQKIQVPGSPIFHYKKKNDEAKGRNWIYKFYAGLGKNVYFSLTFIPLFQINSLICSKRSKSPTIPGFLVTALTPPPPPPPLGKIYQGTAMWDFH